uniref:Putative licpodalin-4 1 n=1 Tax=Amblyomma triste TaxID=251400 RepID=A0A023G9Q1_AMBTT
MKARGMFLLALCLSALAAAIGTETGPDPYEEDCMHFPEQKIKDMVSINGPLYVKLRNYDTRTQYRCHSMENIQKISENVYRYRLRALYPRNRTFTEHYINSTLWESGSHEEPNAANYTENNNNVTVKLMTKNDNNTCFVLVRYTTDNEKHCDLLMTRETVDSHIPESCGGVYLQHCTNYKEFSVELWKKNCISDINIYEQLPAC